MDSQNGDIIRYAHSVDRDEHRSYRVDRMQGARVTNTSFTPRHEVEWSPQGPVLAPPTAARPQTFAPRQPAVRTRSIAPRRTPTPRKAKAAFGKPVHVYQCPLCNKKFRRDRFDGHLNPHKNQWGGQCSGRTGFFVETKY